MPKEHPARQGLVNLYGEAEIERREVMVRATILPALEAARAAKLPQERHLEREQWFVLRARRPGVSVHALAREYGMEELAAYKTRSCREINALRGRAFAQEVRA